MKKLTSLLIAFLMVFATFSAAIPAGAVTEYFGTCGDDLTWVLDDDGTLTISGTGDMYDYTDFGGNVTGSRPPWYGCADDISRVVIEPGVTSIGDYAFWYHYSELTNVVIPDTVTSIGVEAFSSCDGLEEIVIPGSVLTIGNFAFCDCCAMTSVVIGDGVKSIGDDAFSYCEMLTEITIPDSVTSIGEPVFDNCYELETISVGSGNTVYHSDGNCLIKTAAKTLIAGCKNSVIPSDGSVETIGYCAFSGVTGIASVSIPDGVTSIGESAFDYCPDLKTVTIAEGVKTIGDYAF
ncbi:MAG: leucine-rich repeat domain-containing protein, partial [Clostridia bacterium]|nr:leucine-rich repeat domain-containing protein [Clostridia bacterium]